jgi:hypothetical protein
VAELALEAALVALEAAAAGGAVWAAWSVLLPGH